MSNFESKHPRAKDGKFTEKRRKEAGIVLAQPDPTYDPFAEPGIFYTGKEGVRKYLKYYKTDELSREFF